MDSLLAWYQSKISAYDLQVWERAVELTEKNGFSTINKKKSSLKPELIDMDLVRGSMYSKNKPHYSLAFVTCIGMLRVVLFPIFFKWWSNQTTKRVAAGFLLLYCVNIVTVYVYLTANENEIKNISHYEIIIPLINALVIGALHCQVVSTNFLPREKTHKQRKPTKWRTLSSALLEPVTCQSHQKTMSFVENVIGGNLSNVKEGFGDETNHSNVDVSDKDEVSNGKPQRTRTRSSTTYWDDVPSSDSDTSLSPNDDTDQQSDDENDITKEEMEHWTKRKLSATALLPCSSPTMKYIAARIWENGVCKKVQVSLLDIGGAIMLKAKNCPVSTELFWMSLFFSACISTVPAIFRSITHEYASNHSAFEIFSFTFGDEFLHWKAFYVATSTSILRFCINIMFLFMLCVAYRTYKQRFLYAKYFCHLTSSRKAKKSELPHFRLHKVENVRLWLSLRSYLRRRGPQRSVDVIVSTSFIILLCMICFITIQLLTNPSMFVRSLLCWEATVWLLMVSVFMLKFMTLGVRTNQKYRNVSVLIIEQINLYLQMDLKPHKKDEFQRANAVLKLAVKLMKEIERPFNIHGLAMNPLFYNITRVVVLSAFSGVVSEMLGFKLKIWKFKT